MTPAININHFQDEITRRLQNEHYTISKILQYLRDEGITISERTLKTRLKQWNIQLSNVGLILEVFTAISERFHTTTSTDTEIAAHLNT